MTGSLDAAQRFAGEAPPYGTQLYRAAVRLTGNRADTEGLVQETLPEATEISSQQRVPDSGGARSTPRIEGEGPARV